MTTARFRVGEKVVLKNNTFLKGTIYACRLLFDVPPTFNYDVYFDLGGFAFAIREDKLDAVPDKK